MSKSQRVGGRQRVVVYSEERPNGASLDVSNVLPLSGVPFCEVGTTMPTQNRLINHFLEARDREPRVLTQ